MNFKNFFQKKKAVRLTKIEYWKKFRLYELFDLLHQAEELLENNSNPYITDFKNKFIEKLYEIEGDNVADFTNIWEWFKPQSEWNDITNNDGIILGERIFKIVDFWKLNQNME